MDFLKIRPELNNPAKGDYTLRAGSPGIDRGTIIPGVNESRYKGARPDVGWHEHGLEQPVFGSRASSER